ncbi:hypothetical protein EV421DRAFT_1736068 [Armillaria borealis]|uniref:Uncharacterized protein n=1 Tax=Armillaria borealis TaxID=47425 RepID=A0AA39MQX8_9AGAR|nr:hypothetical protein EV421DRAFT_1736068 [Armillaria borealis]
MQFNIFKHFRIVCPSNSGQGYTPCGPQTNPSGGSGTNGNGPIKQPNGGSNGGGQTNTSAGSGRPGGWAIWDNILGGIACMTMERGTVEAGIPASCPVLRLKTAMPGNMR